MWSDDITFHYVIYALMTVVILYLFTRKSYRPKAPIVLTKKEINDLLTSWEPTPLVNKSFDPYYQFNVESVPIVKSVNGNMISLEGADNLINCATTNFLGLAQGDNTVEGDSIKTLRTTGTGSCGPRNFYGTLDVHLEFEEKMAQFLGVPSAILYSSSIATCASVIPTFAGRGDFILSDERVRKSIQIGNYNSRASLSYFRHNDMNHLEELMIQISKMIKKKGKGGIRRFVTVEGIYQNYGTLCRLREVVALAKQYKFRVILDDSVGLGCIGETGRGVVEHFGMNISDIQIYCSDISNSLGSLGGVCCGETDMVRPQRLNGSGYMYSASNPPYICTAGTSSLKVIDEKPELVLKAQKYSKLLHSLLRAIPHIEEECFELSPFSVFRLKEAYRPEDRLEEAKLYESIVQLVRSKGVAIVRTKYTSLEKYPPPPQIKISIMVTHSEEQIRTVVAALSAAITESI